MEYQCVSNCGRKKVQPLDIAMVTGVRIVHPEAYVPWMVTQTEQLGVLCLGSMLLY